jgi:hypothetical protein
MRRRIPPRKDNHERATPVLHLADARVVWGNGTDAKLKAPFSAPDEATN